MTANSYDATRGATGDATGVETVARAESGRGEVVLRRHRGDRAADVWELRVNGIFVMNSQETRTETELAHASLETVAEPRRVLVGGLGLGFTAQAVLADARVEQVVVVEIEEALVSWMRDGTVPFGPALLADKRLHLVNADILIAIHEVTQRYDLVLLDVDNGPGSLVHAPNVGVYEHDFLATVKEALNPGGVLAIWSASAAPELQATMHRVFGNAEERRYDVLLGQRPEQYLLYLSRCT